MAKRFKEFTIREIRAALGKETTEILIDSVLSDVSDKNAIFWVVEKSRRSIFSTRTRVAIADMNDFFIELGAKDGETIFISS